MTTRDPDGDPRKDREISEMLARATREQIERLLADINRIPKGETLH